MHISAKGIEFASLYGFSVALYFLNIIHNASNLREADEEQCVFVWI
jgi:hypothetical protein